MFYRELRVCLAILLCIVCCSGAALAETTAEADLQNILGQLKTYQAKFTQVLTGTNNRVIQRTHGTMRIQKPGQFYWSSYGDSTHQVITVNDSVMWLYDVDLKQVTKQQLTNNFSSNPAGLLSGSPDDLTKNFVVKRMIIADGKAFVLYPRQQNSSFKNIILYFNQGQLMTMIVLNSMDQTARFDFSDVKMNASIDKKWFDFKPPKGVDVLDTKDKQSASSMGQ